MSTEVRDFNALASVGTADMVASLGARMKQSISDMWQRHKLTRSDVETVIASHPKSSRLLHAMAERLGVDYDHIRDAAVTFELQRTCTVCSARGRCRSWLRSGETEATTISARTERASTRLGRMRRRRKSKEGLRGRHDEAARVR